MLADWLIVGALVGTIAAALVARAVLRRRARADLLVRAAASSTRIEVDVWREPYNSRPPDAFGVVCEDSTGTRLLLRRTRLLALLARAEPIVVGLRAPEVTLGPFALARRRWGIKLTHHARETWLVAPARSATGASTRELRDAVGRALGVERPTLAVGELPSYALSTASGGIAALAALAVLGSICLLPSALAVPRSLSSVPPVLVTIPVLAVALTLVFWRTRRRQGLVEFYAHVIVFTREADLPIYWNQVRGYDDGAADMIWLRGDGWSSSEAIPTPTERDRTAVLELLDRRGVPRVER